MGCFCQKSGHGVSQFPSTYRSVLPLPRIRIEHSLKGSLQSSKFLSHAVSGSVGSAELSSNCSVAGLLHPRLIGGPTVNSIFGRFHNMFVCRGSKTPRQKTVLTRDAFETLCETLIQDCGSPFPLCGGQVGYKVSEVRRILIVQPCRVIGS